MTEAAANPFAALNGYELRHLVSHLDAGRLWDQMYRLLAMETAGGANAWFEAKEAADDVNGFVQDAGCARQRAATQSLHDGGERELLFALSVASVRSLAETLPIELVLQLVETRLWTLGRGLEFLRQLPNEAQRARAIAQVARYADAREAAELTTEALRIAGAIDEQRRRAEAIGSVGSSLSSSQYAEARGFVHHLEDPYDRSVALLDWALGTADDSVARAHVREASTLVPTIASVHRRRIAAGKLLKLAARTGEFPAAWSLLAAGDQAEMVASVAHLFDAATIDRALQAVDSLGDARRREEALGAVVRQLLALGRLAQAEDISKTLRDPVFSSSALIDIAQHYARSGHTTEAVSVAERAPRQSSRVRAIAAIAAATETDAWRGLFETARQGLASVFNVNQRCDVQRVLVECASRWGEARLALQLVEEIAIPALRADALRCIAASLPDETVALATSLADLTGFGAVSAAVAALPDAERRTALRAVLACERRIGDEAACLQAAAGEGLLNLETASALLQVAARVRDETGRAAVLRALAAAVPDPILAGVHAAGAELKDATLRARVLAVVLPRLWRSGAATEADLTSLFELPDPESVASALVDIAALFSQGEKRSLLLQAFRTAANITRTPIRVAVMSRIACVDAAFLEPLTDEAVAAIEECAAGYATGHNVEGASHAARVAESAARCVGIEGLERVEKALARLEDQRYRDGATTALIERAVELKAADVARALVATVHDSEYRVRASLVLAGALDAEAREAAFASVRETAIALDELARVRVLLDMAKRSQSAEGDARACADALAVLQTYQQRHPTTHVVASDVDEIHEADELHVVLAVRLVSSEPQAGRIIWSDAVRRLADRPRRQAVELLASLAAPATTPDAVAGIVLRVLRWWP